MFPRIKLPVLNVLTNLYLPLEYVHIDLCSAYKSYKSPLKHSVKGFFARSAKKIFGWMKTYISDFMIFGVIPPTMGGSRG